MKNVIIHKQYGREGEAACIPELLPQHLAFAQARHRSMDNSECPAPIYSEVTPC